VRHDRKLPEDAAMPLERLETLIIGGGQAGLAMSHMLRRRGRPHLVVERGQVAERWRTERWDGLRFQFPNWSVRLPDFPFAHPEPDGFATGAEILAYLTAYAAFVAPPIRRGCAVTRLRRSNQAAGFVAETPSGDIEAANVVVATGPYQRPVVPRLPGGAAAGLFQVHASAYREPAQLPPGAVLVVGSGASGAQIAEELALAGRAVYLSLGRHRRMPRRYRGRDLIWWLIEMGLDRMPVERRGPDATLPLITGAYGGHTIDFRAFAARGIILLGRVRALRGRSASLAPDLHESLAFGDAAYAAFLDAVDEHVTRSALDVPADPAARLVLPNPPCVVEPVAELDLRSAGIGAVVWATGYAYAFGWIDLPVLDARGAPVHERGASAVPGLYFLGLPWLSRMSSSFLSGVGEDAARLADLIALPREQELPGPVTN
jgi:putative flavoprotein involved in K+ transport